MLQGGDFTNGDGTGGRCIFDKSEFEDENFLLRHEGRGVLSMANRGKDSNGSQFFVTFASAPHLDGRHVVFGRVEADDESKAVLNALEILETGRNDVPVRDVRIEDCGVIEDAGKDDEGEDGNEIDLDAEDNEEKKEAEGEKTKTKTKGVDADEQDSDGDEEPEVDEQTLKSNAKFSEMTSVEQRLFLLKMKMNKSRKLNRNATVEEGRRTTEKGKKREKHRLRKIERDEKKKEWAHMANGLSSDEAFLMDSAVKSSSSAQKKEKKKKNAENCSWDMYNSTSQFNAYDKNLKKLPKEAANVSSGVYDPSQFDRESQTTAEGVSRMANELKERKNVEKRRKKNEYDGNDVDYINERNKVFNKKIKRVFDKYTTEIKQNLERGTAL